MTVPSPASKKSPEESSSSSSRVEPLLSQSPSVTATSVTVTSPSHSPSPLQSASPGVVVPGELEQHRRDSSSAVLVDMTELATRYERKPRDSLRTCSSKRLTTHRRERIMGPPRQSLRPVPSSWPRTRTRLPREHLQTRSDPVTRDAEC